jgi:uncharacterized membrane protein
VSALFAFLHHLAAFALVSALVVEFVLIRGELSLATARRIRLYDAVYGASAGIVLVIGLLSNYPTREFIGWGRYLKQGRLPPRGWAEAGQDPHPHPPRDGRTGADDPLRRADGAGNRNLRMIERTPR